MSSASEVLGWVKAMRFCLEYINHLGRLPKKSAQLVRQAHQPIRQAGFTITEVLLAGLMMLIVVVVTGNGVINLLRSNYRANADSEIQNNLNRTLEFVSDEVRRARIIANTQAAINTTQLPIGARAVLAFQIPDPSNPRQLISQQIIYYHTTPTPGNGDGLTGPQVLWRFGPNLDANGNYITPENISTWQHSPVTDRLAEAAANCPPDFTRIPAVPNPDGFFTCVRTGGGQVILNANAQVEMTTMTAGTGDRVDYDVSTRVSTRSINDGSSNNGPRIFTLPTNTGSGTVQPIPLLSSPANIKAEVIAPQGNCSTCFVNAGPIGLDLVQGTDSIDSDGVTIQANSGDSIRIDAGGMNNVSPLMNTVNAYTSDTNPPRSLNNDQVLLVFTSSTSPPNSYRVLVTITPR